jgi:hypothetical protein
MADAVGDLCTSSNYKTRSMQQVRHEGQGGSVWPRLLWVEEALGEVRQCGFGRSTQCVYAFTACIVYSMLSLAQRWTGTA